MELSQLAVSEDEARAKLDEYTRSLRSDRNDEDAAIAAAYRAAARGLQVISLPRTIVAGGWHPNGLPRIAVTRATHAECEVRWEGGDLVFGEAGWRRNYGGLVTERTVRVTIPGDDRPGWTERTVRAGRAPVPLVPPHCRAKSRYRLSRCHILWEVEQWTRTAPRDPALLRHIRGDLWAVLAVWDLTEIERAVLAGRL
jgi:hypothetical protein